MRNCAARLSCYRHTTCEARRSCDNGARAGGHRAQRSKICRTIVAYLCVIDPGNCNFVTRRLEAMHGYMLRHGKTAAQHNELFPLWQACLLQTYFTAKGRIAYFTVHDAGGSERPQQPFPYMGPAPSVAEGAEGALFYELKEDLQLATRDLRARAAVVEDIGPHRADRETWLVHTKFSTHLRGLQDLRPPRWRGGGCQGRRRPSAHMRRGRCSAEERVRAGVRQVSRAVNDAPTCTNPE